MKHLKLFLLFFIMGTISCAQNNSKKPKIFVSDADGSGAYVPKDYDKLLLKDSNYAFLKVDQMPKFPSDLNTYLTDHIDFTEKDSIKNNGCIECVSFIVEKNGSISNIKIVTSVNPLFGFCYSSMRSINSTMEKWRTGWQSR